MATFRNIVAVAASCALAAGCFSVDVAVAPEDGAFRLHGVDGTPREHVVVSNFGWYLFNTFPIVCGNPDGDAFLPFSFFGDDVTLNAVQGTLMRRARAAGARAAGIATHYDSTCMISIIPQNLVPVNVETTFGILWYKEIQISGILVDAAEGAPPARRINPLPNAPGNGGAK